MGNKFIHSHQKQQVFIALFILLWRGQKRLGIKRSVFIERDRIGIGGTQEETKLDI